MSAPTPGWYPDPAVPGTARWWDGSAWTPHTSAAPEPGQVLAEPGAPAPLYTPPTFGPPAYQAGAPTGWAAQAPAPQRSWFARNTASLVAMAASVVYLVIALASSGGVVLVGFLPIAFAVRAFRAKEPLRVAALVVAIAGLLIALVAITGR